MGEDSGGTERTKSITENTMTLMRTSIEGRVDGGIGGRVNVISGGK